MYEKQDRVMIYKGLLSEWIKCGDPEIAHPKADDILCDLLQELGYGEVVDIYNKIEKWYA